jgi:hypothetical protein
MIDDSIWYPPNDFINIVKVERGSTKEEEESALPVYAIVLISVG